MDILSLKELYNDSTPLISVFDLFANVTGPRKYSSVVSAFDCK